MEGEVKPGSVKLIECPRDAMQGWHDMIPTDKKTAYINALLQVGFDTLDFGSFVSPKAIPQMADTKQVLAGIRSEDSLTRLLAIVANTRGAEEASLFQPVNDIGFPFSVSETFQLRNANAGIAKSIETVAAIQEICSLADKRLVIYISMAFGNPYGDPSSEEITMSWIQKLVDMGIEVISLADTVGLASQVQVQSLVSRVIDEFPAIECGVHLHSRPENSVEKLEAAYNAGCRRFDGAIHGIGGCPMAGDDLVGNMDTLIMIDFFKKKNSLLPLNEEALAYGSRLSTEIFKL